MATPKKKVAKKSTKKVIKQARANHKAPKKRVPATKKKEGEFLVTIYLNNEAFEGSGSTPLAAIEAIIIPRQTVKTKVLLTMICGQKKMEQIIMGMQLWRILSGRTAREIWAKRIEQKLQ